MATVTIKGDNKDIQKKLQETKNSFIEVHKVSQKRIKINVESNGKRSYTTTKTQRTSYMLPSAGKGTTVGKTEKIPGLKASTIGTTVGGGLLKALDFAVDGIIGASKVLGRAVFGISGLNSKLEKFQNAMEVYTEPQKEALSRGDKIDALDDERRSHNTQTNAEEFGWSRAFANIGGVNGQSVADKLQSFLEMATSGDIQEMDKAWQMLKPMNITWDDVSKGNTWEVLAKMLKSYAEAGKDGVNELEPIFQQIFGKRQMGIIRKMGDGSELVAQAMLLKGEYDKIITPHEGKILNAAAQSEVIRSQAEIHSMAIPESGIKFIQEGAQHQLDSAKLNYQMLGEDAGKILKESMGQALKDMSLDKLPGFSSLNSVKQKLDVSMNLLSDGDKPFLQKAQDLNNSTWESVRAWNDNLLDSNVKKVAEASKFDGQYRGLFHWNHKMLPNGKEMYHSFDPVGSFLKLGAQSIHGGVDLLANAKQQEINSSLQVAKHVGDLINQLRKNTEATNKMNSTLQKNHSTPTTVTNVSSSAVFY